MAKKVITSFRWNEPGLEHLIPDLCEMYGYPENTGIDIFDDPRLELERVMTTFSLRMEIFDKRIYHYGYPYSNVSVGPSRLSTLLELIARTITEALKGPPCRKHKKLAMSMSPGDIVFSYNYDLLMDNALLDAGKFTDSGYLISFYRTLKEGMWTKPEENTSEIVLVKLHGSLNWVRCNICGSNLLLHRRKTGDWMSFISRFKCPKCHAERERVGSMYLTRLLVPPLLTKSYDDRDINYLWLEAARLLKNVKKIVVIGYSLPKIDFASETLLRTLGRDLNNISLTIVDPDPKVKSRFATIFNTKISEFKDLNHYLRSI